MIANLIGYPITYPIGYPLGFGSGLDRPYPYPIPDPEFLSHLTSLITSPHPSPKRYVTQRPSTRRLGMGR